MPVGPGVDDVEHGMGGLGRRESEDLLQDRVDDRVQPVLGEGLVANMRLFVADLAAVAPLRLDPGQAADIVWATNAAEMYQLLVGQRGWTPQRYQRFLTDTWQRLLLAG